MLYSVDAYAVGWRPFREQGRRRRVGHFRSSALSKCRKNKSGILSSCGIFRFERCDCNSHSACSFRMVVVIDAAFFPECVARVPVSLGGLGVRLCSSSFAFATATVRNRSQASATVCVSAVRLSAMASASGAVPKSSRNRFKLLRVAAVIFAFAEDLSVRVICVAAVMLAFAEDVSVSV